MWHYTRPCADGRSDGHLERHETGDIFAFYQHQTNRNGQPWIEPKRFRLAQAIGAGIHQVKMVSGPEIAQEVVFFYVQKP